MFQHQKTSANDGMAFGNIAMEQNNPCVSSGCSSLSPHPRLPFSAAKLPLELRPLEECAVEKTLPLTPDPAPNAASLNQMLAKYVCGCLRRRVWPLLVCSGQPPRLVVDPLSTYPLEPSPTVGTSFITACCWCPFHCCLDRTRIPSIFLSLKFVLISLMEDSTLLNE